MKNLMYVLADPTSNFTSLHLEVIPINKFSKSEKVNSLSEALEAEKGQADLLIWTGSTESLSSIMPPEPDYGWHLVSVNTPLVIDVDGLSELPPFKELSVAGFYSSNLQTLISFREKIESLFRE